MEDKSSLLCLKILPLVPVLGQMKPVHALPSNLRFNTIVLGLPSSLSSSSGFPHKNLYVFIFSHVHATHTTHSILLDLIT
jgi:hypothetical protein